MMRLSLAFEAVIPDFDKKSRMRDINILNQVNVINRIVSADVTLGAPKLHMKY